MTTAPRTRTPATPRHRGGPGVIIGVLLLAALLLLAPAPPAHAAPHADTHSTAGSVAPAEVQTTSSTLTAGDVGASLLKDTATRTTVPTTVPGGAPATRPATGPATGVSTGTCGVLDIVCDKLPGLGGSKDSDSGDGSPGIPGVPGVVGLTGAAGLGTAIPGLSGIPNPLGGLADVVTKAAADAWTAAMMALWSAGLFVLRIVLTFSELFLTPDLRGGGPGRDVYAFTLWMALSLVMIMALIQLGVAAVKRSGKSLARVLIGTAQFVMVCFLWFGYCAMIVAACGALTRALMKSLLKVNTWPEWDPLGGATIQGVTDGVVATVLGLLGLVLWIAAIAHLLIYLARAAALLVLVATGPLSAAGLVSDAGHSWFWKSLRWFHAAAFTPVIMVLVLGVGIQMSNGVAAHLSDGTQKAIGTALPAVLLICISAVAPLALFKLLAFVDPGTPSGASFRQGMNMQGGLQSLLTGGSKGGSDAASKADSNGRSGGEDGAEDATSSRFNDSSKKMLGQLGGPGQALGSGLGLLASAGAKGTSLLADMTNQAGVGHQTYGPDFSGARPNGSGGIRGGGHPEHQQDNDDNTGGDGTPTPDQPTPAPAEPTSAADLAKAPALPSPPAPPSGPSAPSAPGGQGTPSAPGGTGGGGTGGAGGAAGGGTPPPTPPPVPV